MKKITVIDRDKCQPDTCSHRCIKLCPINRTGKKNNPTIVPKAIKLGKKSVIPYIVRRHCINCNICVNACFVDAIKVVNIPGEMDSRQPTHEYDESRFRLFGLPIINEGTVTGIIGENGIGKSTLLHILAGKMKPNGGYDTDDAYEQFLDDLTTPGMSRYLEDIQTGDLTISLKEQNIISLRQKGVTPNDILDDLSFSEDEDIIDHLQIRKLLDKEFIKLSGGEQQRVAIALTMMKKADVYLLDEPATYLDVKQRLNLVKLLDMKLTKNRAILVVEHDITVLDYLSELIHILWGSPHVYGVVSRALPVRKGLNSFLTGWLREENIHFRRKVISFKRSTKRRRWRDRPNIPWPNINLDRGRFHLRVNSGSIHEGEILVIVGENGLGKTTFADIISGKIAKYPQIGANISYKPQKIKKNFDLSVLNFLQRVTHKYLATKQWKLDLLNPLGISHLLDKQMKQLSGGENQRVFIAACLARDADLYILDEPSAFLDALERTKIASVIRNQPKRNPNSAVIAIEHDIQLTEIMADRIMLFRGEPAKYGEASEPMSKRQGMNAFLKTLDITFRSDPDTGRARINKKDSQLDRKQKSAGEYYCTT